MLVYVTQIESRVEANTENLCNAVDTVQDLEIDLVSLHAHSSAPLTPAAKLCAKPNT